MQPSAASTSSFGLEAFDILRAAAQRTAGDMAEQLAERALRVTERADFAVARDALEALLRRLEASRDAGAILARPRRRSLGWYRVGRREQGAPHYEVLLASLDPLEGSCSCPDYAKASLGLCKHLFLVRRGDDDRPASGPPPLLRWDPVRPLIGAGDWLERLAWVDDGRPLRAPEARARKLFRGSGAGPRSLPPGRLTDARARLAAVETLIELVRSVERTAEPAVAPLLLRERDELTRSVRLAVTAREVSRHLGGLKQKLFLYQREGVRRFLERGRLLLADDMGLGKTAQAIAACHVLVSTGRVRRGLVVVPAPLKPQWQREWQSFSDVPLVVVEGNPEERARIVRRVRRGILLVNYEQVIRDLPQLLAFGPEVVVLDEAQRIKNWATKTAAHVKQLDAPWRLVLTGTPMENRLDELASIMEWVDERAMEPRWRLASWHTATCDGRVGVSGARNLKTLRQRLAPSMLRRGRTEVLEQLPARRDAALPVPLTPAQQAAHDDLNQPIARLVATARRRPLAHHEFLRLMSLLTRQRIVCNGLAQRDFEEVWPVIERRPPGAALLDSLASPKLVELRELLAALAVTQERKVVVFSQWRRMLRLASWAVSDLLSAAGARAVFFSGEESARRRTHNLVDFHDDPAVRVLFATDAGGVGLNLQRAASCCVHLDLPWNPAVLEQRIGRIHRLGQVAPVEVYRLVGHGGIEERIAGLVGAKQALFTGLFDGTTDTVQFDQATSFLSRVEALVERPVVASEGDAGEVDPVGSIDDAELEDLVVAEPQPTMPGEAPATRAGDDEAGGTAGQAAVPTRRAPVAPRAGNRDADGSAADVSVRPAAANPAAALLAQIEVKRLADGRISFEAPEPAAAALAELLQGVAGMLTGRAATAPGDS